MKKWWYLQTGGSDGVKGKLECYKCYLVGQEDGVRGIQFDIPDNTQIRPRKTTETQEVSVKLDLIIFLYQYPETMKQNTLQTWEETQALKYRCFRFKLPFLNEKGNFSI